jgi:hypothetical protein
MLQALQLKNSELKTSQGTGLVDLEAQMGEELFGSQDFASELMASLDPEVKVSPVSVAPEQMLKSPSELLQQASPAADQSELLSPKVFDPALTRGVEQLIQPKTTELALESMLIPGAVALEAQVSPELTAKLPWETKLPVHAKDNVQAAELMAADLPEPEVDLLQSLVRAPQLKEAGRAPAIDFAKSEIDPQLMGMEDFVAQKNLVTKKPLQTNSYGIKAQPAVKNAVEQDLKTTQVVSELGSLEQARPQATPVNSQQFILGMMAEQSSAPKVSETASPVKVFDMSQLKSADANEIMGKISDYIVQAKAAKEPTVNMRMNIDQLGMVDITVAKAQGQGPDAVAVNIGAHSLEGKSFFQQNSKELISHLSHSGITMTEFKVETSSQTAKNDFDMNGQQGRQQGQDKNFGSEQNQRRHESERRQSLWDLLKDKEAA